MTQRIACSLLAILVGVATAAPVDLSIGEAAQSSTLDSFTADLAIDGLANFTHTLGQDDDPTWQVLLPAAKTFQEVTLVNRGGSGSWTSRLRDITVQIVDFGGDVTSDFNGGTVVFSSELLNPDNVLNSPQSIIVDVGGATGNMVRVIRTPGIAESNDSRSLCLNEVTATAPERILSFSSPTPVVTPGDPVTFHWEVSLDLASLQIDNGVGDVLPFTVDGVGTMTFTPGPDVATTYQLTATDANGTTQAVASIGVTNEPKIYSMTADQGYVALGAEVQLMWNVGGNATSLTLNGSDVLGTEGVTVSPDVDSSYELVATNANGSVSQVVSVRIIETGVPVINEFLASNLSGIIDQDGSTSDWIELFNPGAEPARLSGYYLTDDSSDLNKWMLPDITMPAGSYLVVFASGNDRFDPGSELHTNFSLSSSGEYLALVKPDGVNVASEYSPTFPPQFADVSYGIDVLTAAEAFFTEPTPGAENGSSVAGFVEDTTFSIDRGFQTDPIHVDITTLTPGAQVRYTIDGTKPTATTGLPHEPGSPIEISRTTVLRAAAFKDGFESTNVDTHTYIFPSDVIEHPNMDTGITGDEAYGPQMESALTSIPSISLNFAGDLEYVEKEVSIEMINFEDGDMQVDAGMERFGGYVTNFDKRSIRVAFRSRYGPGKLNFDLFENHVWPSYQPAKQYDAIELRAGNHDMSQRGAYLSNRYVDDAMLDMGHIAPHGRFVHVYMNGEYWGQYHLRERWNASMLSEYFGGPKEDYEAINANNSGAQFQTGDVYDGIGEQWDETQDLLNGGSPFSSVRSHLDVSNVIDFMLLWVSGNSESEFRAAGSIPQGVPFKFFMKDGDGYLRNPGHDADHNGPLNAMTILADEGDPDYGILLADRIHKHFFNDGVLTDEKCIERLQDRVNETRLSILSECARWGYRSPESWVSFQDNLINSQFPGRAASMISRFKSADMYPDTDAPVYSEHGGITMPGSGPSISVPDSDYEVYYMFGTGGFDPVSHRHSLDPRLSGGAVNPEARVISFTGDGIDADFVKSGDMWSYLDNGTNQGTAWRSASFVEDGSWELGASELGYGDGDENQVVDYVDTDAGSQGVQKNATTYFRKSDINISDPSSFVNFTLNYVFDDGIAIYVNGVEVERRFLGADAPYDAFATEVVRNNETGSVTLNPNLFVAGDNTIAAEVHQAADSSSDISFDLELVGNLSGGGDPGLTSDPLVVEEPGWLLSRSYNTTNGEWSALNVAFFTPDPIPANAGNLVISEINYHPSNPLTPEELAISTDPDDFEFIELKNVAPAPLDLSGLSFTTGIDFDFATNNLLPVGGRMLIVRNMAAFEARYAGRLGSVIYGTDTLGESQYGGKLGNGGERLVLEDAGGGVIHDFTFDDEAPWPTASDGPGFSLVLLNPTMPVPDHDIATNWAASAEIGGYPGDASPAGYLGDPLADGDLDGLTALLEYALGSSDATPGDSTISSSREFYEVDGKVGEYLTISFLRNQHAINAVSVDPQIGDDLITWSGEPDLVLVSETDNLDGTTSVVYRSAIPVGGRESGREFIRIQVEQ